MHEALKYNDGHICKRGHTEVATFHMESSGIRKNFCGIIEINISVVKPLSEEPKVTQENRVKRIVVELKDYKPMPKQVRINVNSIIACLFDFFFFVSANSRANP